MAAREERLVELLEEEAEGVPVLGDQLLRDEEHAREDRPSAGGQNL
jgi:hypothetical protein